ncbi:MAG: molybdate ABC transporter substrate-binding protein [Gammaproteobacteria bacterium]
MSFAGKAAAASAIVVVVLLVLLMWDPAGERGDKLPSELMFYCAAGIKPPVESVAKQYEAEFGVRIQLQYGGSGTLLSNMRVSRQGDLYLAADDSYIEMARAQDLIVESLPLARMHPVIAVRKGNPKKIHTVADLLREEVALALANPDAAAVGKIVRQLLEEEGSWQEIKAATRVFKPTVSDVANDVRIGSVDAGIVWDATANQYPELEVVEIPAFQKIERTISVAVMSDSKNATEALRFARYLGARDKGLLEFKRYAYTPVEGDVWEQTPELVFFSGGVNRLAVEDTLREFEVREGVRITRVFNGCGILVSQMAAGQRPDMYFACDVSFMTQVEDLFTDISIVSETDVVILTAKGNPLGIHSPSDLARPGIKVGVANEKQSALGALTKRMLIDLGLYDAVSANVKTRTPTADLLVNQMRAGSLDAVVVYRANTIYAKDDVDIVPIEHPLAKAIQPLAVGKNSKHRQLAQRLVSAIESAPSRERFTSTGFSWHAGKKHTQ